MSSTDGSIPLAFLINSLETEKSNQDKQKLLESLKLLR